MRKELRRSSDNQMISGTAAGIAKYFGVDPSIIRLAWVLLFFCVGIGALAYIVCWIVIPEEDI